MRTTTYLLAAAALVLGATALPGHASALRCTPIDTNDLAGEVRCLAGALECNTHGEPLGDEAAAACAAAQDAAGLAAAGVARAERIVAGLDDVVVNPGPLDDILP